VVDLYVRPGRAVVSEQVHPNIEESFTVVHGTSATGWTGVRALRGRGSACTYLTGRRTTGGNAGEKEAQVLVEISPAVRFEEMILNAFGLAQDGKTDAKGRPRLLQAALFAREFDDVIRFTKPPRGAAGSVWSASTHRAGPGLRGQLPEVSQPPTVGDSRGGAVGGRVPRAGAGTFTTPRSAWES
jgi:hypothetical protein